MENFKTIARLALDDPQAAPLPEVDSKEEMDVVDTIHELLNADPAKFQAAFEYANRLSEAARIRFHLLVANFYGRTEANVINIATSARYWDTIQESVRQYAQARDSEDPQLNTFARRIDLLTLGDPPPFTPADIPYTHELPAEEGHVALPPKTRFEEQIIKGSQAELLQLVKNNKTEINQDHLRSIVWARAIEDVDRTGICYTPLIDACIDAGLGNDEPGYVRDRNAVRITPVYRSATFCINQFVEWLKKATSNPSQTEDHVAHALAFKSRLLRRAILDNVPNLSEAGLRSLVAEHNYAGLGPILSQESITPEVARILLTLSLEALHLPLPETPKEPVTPEEWEQQRQQHFAAGMNRCHMVGQILRFLYKKGHLSPAILRQLIAAVRRGKAAADNSFDPQATAAALITFESQTNKLGQRIIDMLIDTIKDVPHREFYFPAIMTPSLVQSYLIAGGEIAKEAAASLKKLIKAEGQRSLGSIQGEKARNRVCQALVQLLQVPERALLPEILAAYPELDSIPVPQSVLQKALTSDNNSERVNVISVMHRFDIISDENVPNQKPQPAKRTMR